MKYYLWKLWSYIFLAFLLSQLSQPLLQLGLELWTQNSWNMSKYFIYERSGRWDTADFWAIFLSSKSLKSESIFFDVEFIEGCFQCLHKKWYVNKTMYFKFINHKQWLVFTKVSIRWSVLSLSISLTLTLSLLKAPLPSPCPPLATQWRRSATL